MNIPVIPNRRLRTPGAAAHAGLSKSTLDKLRTVGGGPRFAKLGRAVVYDTTDIDAWIESRKCRSTSDVGKGGVR
jgi:predicted DNA-binding transcriptional regulator AlpA